MNDKIETRAAAQAAQPEAVGCGLCGADEPFTGSCGGGCNNPAALCFASAPTCAPTAQPVSDLRATLETALARIEDMLADDDGQAFKEARKFLESARPLTASPTAPSTEQRPQNCGTGFCSCIECPYEPSTEASEPVGEREAFEAWCEAHLMPAESDWFRREPDEPDEYRNPMIDMAWAAWQNRAGRASRGAK